MSGPELALLALDQMFLGSVSHTTEGSRTWSVGVIDTLEAAGYYVVDGLDCPDCHYWQECEGEVAKVYDHITGGRISKPNTIACDVIGAADAEAERWQQKAVKDAIDERDGELAAENELLRAALLLACRDGWADSDWAMTHYLDDAREWLSEGQSDGN